MPWRRLLYLIPIIVSSATAVLGVLSLLAGLRELDRCFPGFFFYADGSVAKMQRAGWEGVEAGLRPGDVLVAAEGTPLPNGAAFNRWLEKQTLGQRIQLQLRRDDAPPFVVQLPLRQLTTGDLLATFVLPYSIGVVYLLLGVVIFFLKRTYEAALAMSICVVASVFYMTIFDAHTAHTFSRIWVSYALLGAVSVHLFSVFPGRRPGVHRPLVLALPYTLTTGILALIQLNLMSSKYAALSAQLSSSFLAICFVVDIVLLSLTGRRDPSEVIQNKAKTIRIGLLVTAAAGVVWSLMARIYPELITAERAMMLSGLFPILLTYAVIKKNLFDVDIFLRTTSIYAIATIMVLALYFVVVFVTGSAMSILTLRYSSYLQNVEAVVIFTLILALVFQPLRLRVQKVVDGFFFRSKGQLEARMAALGEELAALTSQRTALGERLVNGVLPWMRCRYAMLLARHSRERVHSIVAAAGSLPAALEQLALPADSPLIRFLEGQREPLPDWEREAAALKPEMVELLKGAEVSLIVPLHTGSSLAGVLLLGPRQHGDVYRRFDLEALRSLALPAALSLENAILLRDYAEQERLAALGKFSAIMIHEVKNPLSIIRVSSGTLKKRFSASESGFELASFIEEEVDRMNRTIARFLAFARPSPPKVAPVRLDELVGRVAVAMREELEAAGIKLTVDLQPGVTALADADQVQQVLLNLLINARQALEGRPAGAIRICLCSQRVGGEPPVAELIISDNGPGIEPAMLERIFEPFVTTRQGGTGLGLAIARQLLVEQRGRIRARPVSGGTEFSITLPAVE